ncbi:hypothetical protein Cenrod_0244 [Candidatus Symbiobacter mobilis CR]|uniref:Uncharacterized protein n=1 Tax=Candidatus Symbiobacter mobilis CR TaxID=946483 RepID=U5N4I4_9BURK|nr:hypothetical protein Cenrod_0244 [Candidatus Symbiobacter mobilis CR]
MFTQPPCTLKFTSITIHFAGVRCRIEELHLARNGAPAPEFLASTGEIQLRNGRFARGSYLIEPTRTLHDKYRSHPDLCGAVAL